MTNALQYICDSEGKTVSVVVPIAFWRELMAERETTYLLSSPTMKKRLLSARKRQDGISLESVCEKLGI
ncbi:MULTISPECIES: prevent-host-death protein [Pseudanabaena]|jgi:PHD/YefM family antitoxin component YafN of YafNO toxin-antitoxin module|uniref:prevent-host-death protein n=1 Tax=Pseudanabaena TaxID=1152 RepID=UPI00247ABD82|nr:MULTISPECIES: prevent-host-death protein [Pseudanabaena]MEA5486910.1 prevent-host-death protein [Pseudanabaena sp. CCNP1317]WGS72228.1 prevent-host-death protein [Pseudanabaena galeata CCNP1313]